MEGIRIKFSVLFLFCVWTVLAELSTAHQGHVIVTKQSIVQVPENKDEQRCMALLRRTIVRKELLTYPCFHPVPGVVPVVAHQTPMGLVCRGYVNNPSTQYIRLPTCCPGFKPDVTGRCTKKVDEDANQSTHVKPEDTQQPQQPTKRLEDLEKYPASYENKRQEVLAKVMAQPQHWAPHPMIMRRIEAILKQRAHFMRQMQNDLTKGVRPPMSQTAMISGLFSNQPHRSLGHPRHQQPQVVPEIPKPSQDISHQKQMPHHPHHPHQKQMPHHPHQKQMPHHPHHPTGPSVHHAQNIPHAFHKDLHKHNIPHAHDKQGNPIMHALKQQFNSLKNDAFIKHQHNMQMAAKRQQQLKRQQQMYQIQQQRQHAMEMRQRMLHQRRIQQEQARMQQEHARRMQQEHARSMQQEHARRMQQEQERMQQEQARRMQQEQARMQQEQARMHQNMMMQARQRESQSYRHMPFVPRRQMYQQSPAVKPFVIRRHYVSKNNVKDFPNVPQVRASVMLAVSPNMMEQYFQHTSVRAFPNVPTQQMQKGRYPGVQLPRIPVETPPVSIRPGPNSHFHLPPPPPCFVDYLVVVKRCFQDAQIQIPNDHSAFNVNFNYNGVCQKREVIMSCIFNNLPPCKTMQEHLLVKSTIGHTVDEMNRFCQIGQINGIEERLGGMKDKSNIPIIPNEMQQSMNEINIKPVQEVPIIPDNHQEMPIIPEDHHAMSLGQHNIIVQPQQNEVVPEISVVPEKLPKSELAPKSEQVTKNKNPAVPVHEHTDSNNVMSSAHAHTHDDHDHDHEHDVHMMELQEEEYYLPILIGTAIGVAGIFILLMAILCVCCRRRLKKKLYLQKETEKPRLFDVYTIGVPPPVYEVNGIPPISYEEAKGEKFTGSPTSIRRNNAENESHQDETRSVSGTVSDI